jgi:hypothetical protein
MLKVDLKESDIPSQTTLSNRILGIFNEHLDVLEADMKVRTFFLSLILKILIILRNHLAKYL